MFLFKFISHQGKVLANLKALDSDFLERIIWDCLKKWTFIWNIKSPSSLSPPPSLPPPSSSSLPPQPSLLPPPSSSSSLPPSSSSPSPPSSSPPSATNCSYLQIEPSKYNLIITYLVTSLLKKTPHDQWAKTNNLK